MLVGEPGIGKSRTIEEFAEQAQGGGTLVLTGRCFEGEWAPPYAPFARRSRATPKTPHPHPRRSGYGRRPSPAWSPRYANGWPTSESRCRSTLTKSAFRLLDAVAVHDRHVGAGARRARARRPALGRRRNDRHAAPRGALPARQRTLVLGAYRDVELDRQHPLADALAALRSEARYERILVRASTSARSRTPTDWAEHDVPDAFVQAISAETDGNPFFIRGC
jgi:predicted ATPase